MVREAKILTSSFSIWREQKRKKIFREKKSEKKEDGKLFLYLRARESTFSYLISYKNIPLLPPSNFSVCKKRKKAKEWEAAEREKGK